jgi:drug/metabolite transporter (DMT)-like permease
MSNAPIVVDRTPPPRWLIVAVLGTIYVTSGSAFLAIRFAVETLPPFTMASSRFVLSGAILLVFVGIHGGWSALRTARKDLIPTILASLGLLVIINAGIAWSEQTQASGLTAIIIGSTTFWVVLISRLWLRERVSLLTMIGVIAGLIGLAVLIGPSTLHFQAGITMIVLLVGAFGWAVGAIYQKVADVEIRPLKAAAIQQLFRGAVLAIVAIVTEEHVAFTSVTAISLIGFAWLVVVGSAISFPLYLWLIHRAPVSLVSTYAYVSPVVAVILGALILDETVNLRTILAGGAVIASSAVVLIAQSRTQAGPVTME